MVKHLKALAAKIPDTIARENLKPILDEMAAEIDSNTLDRMAAFLQSADDRADRDAEKLSLAISGWLLGADAATPKLATAISAYKVRGLILEYLAAASAPERERAYDYIKEESAGDPAMVAELLAHMKPPVAAPEPVAGKPGYYDIPILGLAKEPPTAYYVQLPPEYDPYRRYPTIVTLNGVSTARAADRLVGRATGGRAARASARPPATAISSSRPAGPRAAEAIRLFGPRTRRRAQLAARRLPAVFDRHRPRLPLRPVDRRRRGVGHRPGASRSMGGRDPDRGPSGPLSAPTTGKTPATCRSTSSRASWTAAKLVNNARDLDRYLRRGFDTTVVEYRGRGHEDFYDEILRIFDWMGRFHRNFFPREFTCETMRSWDNFFWWVEVQGLPPRSLVDPADWPPPAGTQPSQVKAKITDSNGLSIRAGTTQVTVWLSPKMLDFDRRAAITVNGRRHQPGGPEDSTPT